MADEPMKRVGIIVRANSKGLGYQSLSAFQNYDFQSALLVTDGNRRAAERTDWYPNVHAVRYDPINHQFEDWDHVFAFMDEVDVIFSVETLYDWSLADLCRRRGIKTVVQGNPELYGHEGDPTRPHPDRWTWPTEWRTHLLPPGPIVPVPVPNDCWAEAGKLDEPLTLVHVGGHRANADRNGTELFMKALPQLASKEPIRVRVYSQEGRIPEPPRLPANVDLELKPHGVLDRWEMYDGAHALVMPRRYGGLCLPVQEAMTAGLAVLMTDCSPNPQTWPVRAIPHGRGRMIHTPAGNIMTCVAGERLVGQAMLRLQARPDSLEELMRGSREWAAKNTWENLRPMYDELFQSWE
jgi:hypothetical protein